MLTKFLRAAAGNTGGGIQYVGGYVIGRLGNVDDINITLTSLTGGIASAPAAGDFVLIYWCTADVFTNTISGYTSIATAFASDNTPSAIRASYKFMTSTPDTSATVTGGTGNSNNPGAAYVSVWRGVNTTTPMDVTRTTASSANSVLANPPAITPVTSGAVIVAGGAGGHIAGTQTFSSSNLTSFLSAGANDTRDVTIGGGYNEWTSGAFDPAAFTFSSSDATGYSWCAITVALRPA